MTDEQPKRERDWVKEPYNTWDTLAAMHIPPMPSDKGDIAAIEKRLIVVEQKLDRILELLTA